MGICLRKVGVRTVMLRDYIFLCIFVAMLLSVGCTNEQANLADGPTEDNIISERPFPSNSKFIMIPVSLNGKEFQFVLDTGSTITVFDISLKEQLGWRIGSSKARAADGKTIKIEYYQLRHAHFGGLCKKHKKVAVLDLNEVSKMAGRRVDGIIGMDLLKNHVIRLDFKKNIVSFLRSSNKSIHPGWEADLSLKKNQVHMKGEVEDIPVSFLIDTGFTESYFGGLLEPAVIERLNAKTIGDAQGDQASSVAGPMDFNQRKTIVAKLCFNLTEYEEVFFVEHNESILGLGFLSRHVVTFDFPKKKVYMEEIANAANSSEVSLALHGFDFTVINRNGNIIAESVDVNGLGYKKGIRQKDIILKINNHDVTSFGLARFASFLISLPEQQNIDHLTITIKRDDKIKEITFP